MGSTLTLTCFEQSLVKAYNFRLETFRSSLLRERRLFHSTEQVELIIEESWSFAIAYWYGCSNTVERIFSDIYLVDTSLFLWFLIPDSQLNKFRSQGLGIDCAKFIFKIRNLAYLSPLRKMRLILLGASDERGTTDLSNCRDLRLR